MINLKTKNSTFVQRGSIFGKLSPPHPLQKTFVIALRCNASFYLLEQFLLFTHDAEPNVKHLEIARVRDPS